MRRPRKMIPSAIILLALAGCSGAASPTTTAKPKAVSIAFASPALRKGALPARYTCDGHDISPPMAWGAVPTGTKELAIFILGFTTSPAKSSASVVSVEWALAGINPALHRLTAGQLPPGTHIGYTSKHKPHHYSICPSKGTTKQYQFALYAIPPRYTIPASFESNQTLDKIAAPESPNAAKAGGNFTTTYTRK